MQKAALPYSTFGFADYWVLAPYSVWLLLHLVEGVAALQNARLQVLQSTCLKLTVLGFHCDVCMAGLKRGSCKDTHFVHWHERFAASVKGKPTVLSAAGAKRSLEVISARRAIDPPRHPGPIVPGI